jgi:hypothetical protein
LGTEVILLQDLADTLTGGRWFSLDFKCRGTGRRGFDICWLLPERYGDSAERNDKLNDSHCYFSLRTLAQLAFVMYKPTGFTRA